MQLDSKDPAIPLNYAVLCHNTGSPSEAGTQLKIFESRVSKLREMGLDADPDVRKDF